MRLLALQALLKLLAFQLISLLVTVRLFLRAQSQFLQPIANVLLRHVISP